MDKKKQVVDLSPQNSAYAEKIAKARLASNPVGGAPMPKMPNFAEAQQQGDRYSGVQNQGRRRNQGMATLLTPEERAELEAQGKAIPGIGSAYLHNQPAARELNKQAPGYANPPRAEGAGLSEQTAQQLEAVAKANAPETAAAAPKDEESPDKLRKELDNLEDALFDFDEFGNKVKNLLANKERREAIEARCELMDLMELLVNKECRQTVPIIPGKYFPTFRTMGGDEDLEVKRLIGRETDVSTQYVMSKVTLMNLACGLYALNSKPLPTHLDSNGVFDAKLFEAKLKGLLKYPMQVLADLAVNYTWFDRRVRELIAFENIKDF